MATGYESGGYFVGLIIITCILLVEFEPSDIPLALWICLSIAILATCAAALYQCRKASVALPHHGDTVPPYFITSSLSPNTPPRRDSPPTYMAATLADLPPPTYASVVHGMTLPTMAKQLESDLPPPLNTVGVSVTTTSV